MAQFAPYLTAVRLAASPCPAVQVLLLADAALAIASAFDIDRSIKFSVANNTDKQLKLLFAYMDCGKVRDAPAIIEPRTSAEGYVSAKFGSYGVKGALTYQWGDDEKERVCFFLENPVRGGNYSGIKYYWNSWNDRYWYYLNVPKKVSGEEVNDTINGWFTITSLISGGNNSGASFVLET